MGGGRAQQLVDHRRPPFPALPRVMDRSSTTGSPRNQREQDRLAAETVTRERGRLLRFIERHVPDSIDAEDILQDVFFELVVAYRLMKPIEHVAAWMFRVARNRITDRFRRRRLSETMIAGAIDAEEDSLALETLLPGGVSPEAAFARNVLIEELERALAELPMEQREVFLAHEFEGRSFRDLASASGESINTLL